MAFERRTYESSAMSASRTRANADLKRRLIAHLRSKQGQASIFFATTRAAFVEDKENLMATHKEPSLSSKSAGISPWRHRLEGKVAVITGGASGIGAATVRLFKAHGASVLIGDIQDKLGADLAQELAPNASFLHCDVTQENDVEALVDAAVRKHGRLDIMYNNAGVIGPIDTSIQELQVEDMDKVYTVNVRGTLLAMKHAVRVMIPAKKGVILAMAKSH